MHYPASMVGEDQKDEQHLETDGRNSEEVDEYQVLDMIVQESSPGRRQATPGRARYFSTVDLATSMPSLASSPTMRGEPQFGLARERRRMTV